MSGSVSCSPQSQTLPHVCGCLAPFVEAAAMCHTCSGVYNNGSHAIFTGFYCLANNMLWNHEQEATVRRQCETTARTALPYHYISMQDLESGA